MTPELSLQLQNSLTPALLFVGVFATTIITFYLSKRVIASRLTSHPNPWISSAGKSIQSISWLAALITALFAATHLVTSTDPRLPKVSEILFVIIWIWQGVQILQSVVNVGVEQALQRSKGHVQRTTYEFVTTVLKFFIWLLAALLILSNLGYDITSLVAGLGIGGIAIALAVQSLLSDFISSFSIVVDNPFEVGDFIEVDGHLGTVEKVGIKSTRVRSVNGELLVVPNSTIVRSTVSNFGNLNRRRAIHTFTVSDDMDIQLAGDIPVFIGDIVSSTPKVDREDYRVHCVRVDSGKLVFEVVFYIASKDYKEFLDIQQEVLFKIEQKFRSEKIDLI